MVAIALLAAAWGTLFRDTAAFPDNGIATLNATAIATCQQLQSVLGTIIKLPSDPTYTNLSDENWSQTAWKQPSCIALPANTTDTQKVVSILVANGVPFAIRSGGHSPNPFDANINTGVLISTDNLNNQVLYDAASSSATFGPGLRWDAVYSALDPYNVSLVGGRVMDVGVGGLTLGGGLSYLSDLYGLVCDNIISYEVVLADGSAVVADSSQNADLFWALKGGSNNFGIVTKFKSRTYPISQVWGGMQIFSPSQASEVMQALYEYQATPDKDPYANCIVNIAPINSSVLITYVYLKPIERPEAFAPFFKVTPLVDYTGFYTLHQLMAAFPSPSIPRWTWFTSTYEANQDVYAQVASILSANQSEVVALSKIPYGTLSAAIQPISKNAVLAGSSQGGGNALGLKAVDQLWLALDFGWVGEEYDDSASSLVESLLSKIDAQADAVGVNLPYVFMNDANIKQEVIESYGDDSVQRLRAVQHTYDPDHVFQRLVPGGQKLPAA
ncbi:Bifunctional solanapyrone synthase [Cytospora mali]|uniref:Bifunctional solanapyrone synthase n=1 Tax=Cytospora mali TaxID=578113 RepID=A0A194V340_CYTMA|nr:Bifunctional solanapyrone synthase [Valsa mali var. pyri (nom. inval.)]